MGVGKNKRATCSPKKESTINDKNYLYVDLTTGATTQTDYEITQEQIETSAQIFANILIDFAKWHGTTTLIPEAVFGKGERNE